MTDDRYPTLQTRVPPELAERIRRSAARQQVSVSAWLRDRALAFLDGQTDDPDERTQSRSRPVSKATIAAAVAGGPELVEALVDSARFSLPHIVGSDGSCAGGCDPDTDLLCSVGPDDPRRTGKRKRP